MNRFSTLIAALALVALVIATGALVALLLRPQTTAAAPNTVPVRQITAVGQGETKAAPDTAHVQLGVQTEAETAQAALSENNTRMQALIAKLKELGIADKDIQTSNLNIWPRYTNDGRTVDGYQASNMVSVTIRNIGQTGELLDKVVEAGANNISGIAFSIDDPTALQQAAIDSAIANARAQAAVMAKAAGGTVGQVLSISENIGMQPPVPYAKAAMADQAGGGAPVQPGEQTINAQVQVTFELQ